MDIESVNEVVRAGKLLEFQYELLRKKLEIQMQEIEIHIENHKSFIKCLLKRINNIIPKEFQDDEDGLCSKVYVRPCSIDFHFDIKPYSNLYQVYDSYIEQLSEYEQLVTKKKYELSVMENKLKELASQLDIERKLLIKLYAALKTKELYATKETCEIIYEFIKLQLCDESGNISQKYKNSFQNIKNLIGDI